MSLKCYYHPEREAQSKCDKCGKIICLECEKSFNVSHGTSERSYSTRHEYCLPCYYDRRIKLAQSSAACFMCIAFNIIGLIMFTSVPTSGTFDIFSMLPTIFLIALIASILLFIYKKFFDGPKRAEKIKGQKESFLESIKLSSNGTQETTPITSKKFCSMCGGQIEKNISICPKCGSNISG